MFKNGTLENSYAAGGRHVLLLDKQCPICGADCKIFLDVNEHPNSMFSITPCNHINISRCCDEETAQEELDEVLREIINYKNA